MPKGIIRRLVDGSYGFIKAEDEKDIFFHSSSLEGVEYSSLREGQEVEFEMGQGRDGRTQATKVRLTETQASDNGGDDQESADDQDEDDQVKNHRGGGETEG